MSEVSQLNEMHAVLIGSKEDNDRKREEAEEMMEKISELEKRLEEGVAFTNRYRATKAAATGGLRKRAQTLDDLFLKLDHVAQQTSAVQMSRTSVTAEGVQDRERVATQVNLDLNAAFERLNDLLKRHRECLKQEAQSKSLLAANRSRGNEAKELANRVAELDALCSAQDQDVDAADVTGMTSQEAMEARRAEGQSLKQRLGTLCTNLQHTLIQMSAFQAEIQAAECSWNDEMGAMVAGKKSSVADAQGLNLRLAELSDDVTRHVMFIKTISGSTGDIRSSVPEAIYARIVLEGTIFFIRKTSRAKADKPSLGCQLTDLEAEKIKLAGAAPEISIELEEAKRQCKQDDPQVVELRTQLQEKTHRRQFLIDHLAASQKVNAVHSVNQPEFGKRKAEHEELSSSIETLRLTGTEAAARKIALEHEVRLATDGAAEAAKVVKDDISALSQGVIRAVAARNDAVATVAPLQTSLTKMHNELDSLQGKTEEASAALESLSQLQQEVKNETCIRDPGCDKEIASCEQVILEQRVEVEIINRSVESLGMELKVAKTKAKDELQRRAEAAKQDLLTEAMARKTAAMIASIEGDQMEELKRIQDEIVCEDTRLRTACTTANQSPPGGGREDILKMELNDLRAGEASIRSEVEAVESRVQRLNANAPGQLATIPD